MIKDQILEEVRRLPQNEQIDVLERIVQIVAPVLSREQDEGLGSAIDAAEAGDLVDGPTILSDLRKRVRESR